jgi:hypothetical protein
MSRGLLCSNTPSLNDAPSQVSKKSILAYAVVAANAFFVLNTNTLMTWVAVTRPENRRL